MIVPGFCGGSNPLASMNVDSEITRNWFPESGRPGTPKADPWLAPVPGLRPFVVLGSGPVRGLFSQDGRAFAVAGNTFYEVFANHTATYRGRVAADSRPATMCSNGSGGFQIFITSGGLGYIYNLTTNTLTQITDSEFPFPCTMGAFCDGYFLALKGSSNQFQWSALEDGLTWNGLDVAQLSQSSDNIQTLIAVHGQIWLLGTNTSVVWTDTGGSSAFEPIPGSLMQQGTFAPFSAWAGDNALVWVGGNDQGKAVVYRGTGVGAVPQRVSTFAVEYALNNAPRLQDCIGWGYQENGHTFYALQVESMDTTWVYDIAMNAWHERSLWDPVAMKDIPDPVRCHTFCFGQHLVGDRQSAAIYAQDFNLATCEVVEMGA